MRGIKSVEIKYAELIAGDPKTSYSIMYVEFHDGNYEVLVSEGYDNHTVFNRAYGSVDAGMGLLVRRPYDSARGCAASPIFREKLCPPKRS